MILEAIGIGILLTIGIIIARINFESIENPSSSFQEFITEE
jgi:hypothetical protein